MILVPLLNPKFATAVAADDVRTSGSRHLKRLHPRGAARDPQEDQPTAPGSSRTTACGHAFFKAGSDLTFSQVSLAA